MKKLILLLVFCVLSLTIKNVFPQFVLQIVKLNGNNISTYFSNRGIFNKEFSKSTAGFEWPINSGKHAIYSTGLCISAKVNGGLAQSMASYKGEFAPGIIVGGVPLTSPDFHIYKISRGDSAGNNPDYANWGLMVPYGAPFIDVNNNQVYDPGIDSAGIRSASQVFFLHMTDAFDSLHDPGEGFGGGITNPLLYTEISWTAWCYDRNDLKDIQFIKWVVINKGVNPWYSTYFSLVGDPDLGDGNDDYIGCDTSKKLGYCYNADNNDPQYGANPPAVGMILHKTPKNLTSFTFFSNTGSGGPPCETDPNGEPYPAYLLMKGFKKDSSNYMNPLINPPVPTKFVYTGDPETNTGWTEYKGSVQNCGGNNGIIINVNPPDDRRFILSSGAENYTVYPGDTITIYASQLIARGSSNLNSVTLLKNLANVAWSVYNGGFSVGIQKTSSNVPTEFALFQNYPNPFNPSTSIKYQVESIRHIKLVVYDILGKEIATLVNEKQSPGTYEVTFDGSKLTSGIYFYRFVTDGFSETKKMVLLK
ncbi:MAG: T9SS type A sorting domain-containing protein [Ignavibacteriae bacterium]|nr:T9SS type A sorting domain-containing protein [Ignavibacteriota bacterium]